VQVRDLMIYLTGSQHHATTDSGKRVSSETGSSSDGPAEEERGPEVALESSGEDEGLKEVDDTEVETTVDNNTNDGR
jgi:hypothetical protein